MDTAHDYRAVTAVGGELLTAMTAEPANCLLALDFDGTLSPIVDDPAAAAVHPRSRAALLNLVGRLGSVAIITGRPVAVVRELADLDVGDWAGLVVLGQYGVERWDAVDGRVRSPEPPAGLDRVRSGIEQILASLAALGIDTAGASIEDKGRAVALHTRRAASPQRLLDLTLAQIAGLASAHGLTVEPGKYVVEVRAEGTTKADALAELIEHFGPVPPQVVVMVGDDLGDLPAFELVHHLPRPQVGGVVVSDSGEQPRVARHADVLAQGPDGVADWLDDLVAGLHHAQH